MASTCAYLGQSNSGGFGELGEKINLIPNPNFNCVPNPSPNPVVTFADPHIRRSAFYHRSLTY